MPILATPSCPLCRAGVEFRQFWGCCSMTLANGFRKEGWKRWSRYQNNDVSFSRRKLTEALHQRERAKLLQTHVNLLLSYLLRRCMPCQSALNRHACMLSLLVCDWSASCMQPNVKNRPIDFWLLGYQIPRPVPDLLQRNISVAVTVHLVMCHAVWLIACSKESSFEETM
jgi:hypothetical protein